MAIHVAATIATLEQGTAATAETDRLAQLSSVLSVRGSPLKTMTLPHTTAPVS